MPPDDPGHPDPANEGKEAGQGKEPTVPRKALEDERGKRQALETENARLTGQIEGLAAAPTADSGGNGQPQIQEQELTPAELTQAVTEGRLTEGEAEAIRERRRERQIDRKIDEKVETTVAVRDLNTRVNDEITRYRQVIPDLNDKASAAWQKIQVEFDNLVSLGNDSKNTRTQLMAARAAFGPIANLEKAATAEPRETHQEAGGGGPGGGDGGNSGDAWPKDTTTDQKNYYTDLIGKGIYTRENAIVELKRGADRKKRKVTAQRRAA